MSQTQARHLQAEQRDQLVVQPSAAQLVALCRAALGLSFLIGAGWSCTFRELAHGRTHKGWLPFSHLSPTFSVPEGLPEHFQPNPSLVSLTCILHGNSARELCIHHHGSHLMDRQTRPASHKLTCRLTKTTPATGRPKVSTWKSVPGQGRHLAGAGTSGRIDPGGRGPPPHAQRLPPLPGLVGAGSDKEHP